MTFAPTAFEITDILQRFALDRVILGSVLGAIFSVAVALGQIAGTI